MDFQRFFDAFEAQAHNVTALAHKVDELRLSNLQLLQAVKRAERLPRVLDPESKKVALRMKEQALVLEREQLRQQRARKMLQIDREMAAAAAARTAAARLPPTPQGRPQMDVSALSRVQGRPGGGGPIPPPRDIPKQSPSAGGGASTSLSTEDELNNTVIAKDRLDLFRQVTGGQPPPGSGLTSSLLDQVNLESPSAAANGNEESLTELSDAGPVPYYEDASVYGGNTTTGFYTTSTDILQYMRHSTNTITSMFTLQEEEEEDLSSRRQTPAGPATLERPNPQPRAVNGERQHLTRYLMEASLPDDESEAPRPSSGRVSESRSVREETASRPWDMMMEEQFEAQAELGLKLQEEIRAQEDRLRAQMYLLTKMRNNNAQSGAQDGGPSPPPSAMSQVSLGSRHTPYPAVIRSEEDVLSSPALRPTAPRRLPTAAELPPELQSKFCRVSALIKGFLTRRLYHSDRAQTILKTIKDTAECALSLSESADTGSAVVNRRQDAFLHSRLVSQLQASLYDFHDLFFASTPAQRMAVIRATRAAQLDRERLRLTGPELELESIPEKEDEPEKRAPRLSAATLRRIQMREKGQLHNVVNPRFVNKPLESAHSSEEPPRPSTAPTHPSAVRSHIRVLRPIHLQQQPSGVPAPKPRGGVQRSRSLNSTKPTLRPSTAPPVTRSQGQPKKRGSPRPIHVVQLKDQGRKLTRKVRAAPSGDDRDLA